MNSNKVREEYRSWLGVIFGHDTGTGVYRVVWRRLGEIILKDETLAQLVREVLEEESSR